MAAFAASLDAYPPGTFSVSLPMATRLIALGANVFVLACRIALPIIALLLMVDLALGVLGRINAQLQAGLLSFPLKMMLVLVMLALMMPYYPTLYAKHAGAMLAALRGLVALR
jgi:flagellar biosynthetic protein FliR